MKKKIIIAIMVLLIAIVITSCRNNDVTQTSASNDSTVTLDEFNQLSTNMSYEDAVSIIGSEGTVISEVDMSGYDTIIYQWDGKGDVGANANATFQNDKLVSKAQSGLK